MRPWLGAALPVSLLLPLLWAIGPAADSGAPSKATSRSAAAAAALHQKERALRGLRLIDQAMEQDLAPALTAELMAASAYLNGAMAGDGEPEAGAVAEEDALAADQEDLPYHLRPLADGTRLHSEPSVETGVVADVDRDTTLTVIDGGSGWYQVVTPESDVGFVRDLEVAAQEPTPGSTFDIATWLEPEDRRSAAGGAAADGLQIEPAAGPLHVGDQLGIKLRRLDRSQARRTFKCRNDFEICLGLGHAAGACGVDYVVCDLELLGAK
jgi:hypothetical protein